MSIEIKAAEMRSCEASPSVVKINNIWCITEQYKIEVAYTLVSNDICGPVAFISSEVIPYIYTDYIYTDGETTAEWGRQVLLTKKLESIESLEGQAIMAKVVCTYGQATLDTQRTQRGPSPEDPVQISCSLVEREIPLKVDRTGRKVVNSAGEFFYDPITVNYHERQIRISRKEYRNPLSMAMSYTDRINSTAIWGFPAYTLKLTVEHSFDSKDFGWNVTYVFETRWDTWWSYPLDQGFKEIKDGLLVPILDDDGSPISTPALLDGSGHQLSSGGSPVYPSDPFKGYLTANFNGLRLPQVNWIV